LSSNCSALEAAIQAAVRATYFVSHWPAFETAYFKSHSSALSTPHGSTHEATKFSTLIVAI
jgi:hypothetical protein